MLSRVNSTVYVEGSANESNDQNTSWAQNNDNNNIEASQNKEEQLEAGGLTTFKSLLEAEGEDWYLTNNTKTSMHGGENNISFSPSFTEAADHHSNHHQLMMMMLNHVGSSASEFNTSPDMSQHHQVNYFSPPNNNSALQGSFDLSCGSGYLENDLSRNSGFGDLGTLSLLNQSLNTQFGGNYNLLQLPQGVGGLGSSLGFGDGSTDNNNNSMFLNRSNKILKPLDNFTSSSVGSQQPTLFQKRAALRKNLNNGGLQMNHHHHQISLKSSTYEEDVYSDRKRKAIIINGDDVEEDLSPDGSNLNYDSDDLFLENNSSTAINIVDQESAKNDSTTKSTVTGGGGDQKGKKKGLPAKNLMAERRRRKKLNDRLYMLRSVVPKISKMDRASILGDAIDYLKELLQKINDLHNELESSPGSSSLTPATNFYPPTPITTRIKEEMCPSSFPSTLSSPTAQSARVEVRLREGNGVNIHMFCGRRPGILQSTLRAMDNLGLDVQQAVISCFNGFALDIFRAEQCGDGQEMLNPDQIKSVLIESAGFHGMA